MKLKKDDIYPAPAIAEAFPPTLENLSALISERGENPTLLFSLGNVFLRDSQFPAAEQTLKKALQGQEFQHELLTNLGVALLAQGKPEEALSNFRQAILLNSDMLLPHLHSGRTQFELNELVSAKVSFEKAIKINPELSEAYMALADIAERQGDNEAAGVWYKQAFAAQPKEDEARIRLAVNEFERGRDKFLIREYEHAFQIWSDANKQFSPAFATEQRIVTGLQQLIKQHELEAPVETLRLELLKEWKNAERRAELVFQVISRSLFLFGLVPECFESRDTLFTGLERWRESLQALGEHPYPHFRIGLIHGYRGEFSEAESEMRYCQDKLLPKKQSALKLDRLVNLFRDLKDLETQAAQGLVEHSADFDWEQAGFENVFERNSWKQAGIMPTEAKIWRENGFSAAKAKVWISENVPPDIAKKWSEAGATTPARVKKWARVGVEPEDALKWEKVFADNVEQAIQCRNVGFTEPALAYEWLQVVLFPWDAIRWHELQFTPAQARQAFEDGVRDPARAMELGYQMVTGKLTTEEV